MQKEFMLLVIAAVCGAFASCGFSKNCQFDSPSMMTATIFGVAILAIVLLLMVNLFEPYWKKEKALTIEKTKTVLNAKKERMK